MMDEPILSIAIPTYNRYEYLKKNVLSILNNIHSDNYEILISDNHSPDERVKEFLEEISKEHSNIRYVINEENIGPDLNFLNALRLSNGKFIHLLGDDDIAKEGCDDKLIAFLEKNQDLDYVSLHKISDDEYAFQTPYEYMLTVGVWITYMSELVFKRDNFAQVKNPEKYNKSLFLQSYLVIESLASSTTKRIAAFNQYDFIPQNVNNIPNIGYSLCDTFIGSLHNVVFSCKDILGFSKRQCKTIFSKSTKWISRNVLLFKIFNKKHVGPAWKYFFAIMWKYFYGWLLYLPIIITPSWLLKLIRNVYKKLKRK